MSTDVCTRVYALHTRSFSEVSPGSESLAKSMYLHPGTIASDTFPFPGDEGSAFYHCPLHFIYICTFYINVITRIMHSLPFDKDSHGTQAHLELGI